ncbi:MAG: cation transporter [Deltaproteobacteria bacterium]|nr:cation transporter [Deltaproteobacteria bacterium]
MNPEQIVRRVTWWGLFWNLALASLKLGAGYWGGSRAVLADGMHSLSDLVTDAAVIGGSFLWSRPADEDHPYGHRRMETFVTVFIALMLAVAGIGIAWEALGGLGASEKSGPGPVALAAAVASILVKEILFRWTMIRGRQIQSRALKANAWHHRSDALSSIPVVVAVLGAMLVPSWTFLDPLGAFVVAVFILKSAWDILAPALRELSEAGAPSKVSERIRSIALAHPEVHDIHKLRTRYQGGAMFVDYHLVVDRGLILSRAHDIGEEISAAVGEAFPEVVDVTYHLDPDDAED